MYEYKARLDRVVDGDTVDLIIDLGFHVFTKQRIRLSHVDTPERGEDNYEEATAFVKNWFEDNNDECIITTNKTGKYGRWLAWVYNNEYQIESLNSDLILEGLGEEYRRQK